LAGIGVRLVSTGLGFSAAFGSGSGTGSGAGGAGSITSNVLRSSVTVSTTVKARPVMKA
jgi:hypothetical protein